MNPEATGGRLRSEAAHCIAPCPITVKVGTARMIREAIAEQRGALDFKIASNPEFLREGSAVADFMYPDRIVIGADDKQAADRLAKLYQPILSRGVPLVRTGTTNAELIKYAANALLALRIGFINDVADLCENIDGDISAIARGIGLDHRIGASFLAPGPGYGGSCFPKDTEAFAAIGRKHNAPQSLVETLIKSNQARKRWIAERIAGEVKGLNAPQIAVLGMAFKANTDDVRESPALEIIPYLQARGARVRAFDPWARGNAEARLPQVIWAKDPYEATQGADLLVVLTEWKIFRDLDMARIFQEMRIPSVFDCRNLFDGAAMAKCGFRYVSLGRAPVSPVLPPAITHPSMSIRKRGRSKMLTPSRMAEDEHPVPG